MSHPLPDMLTNAIEKIKTLSDANTIIGEPISMAEVTIIPVSKVSYGFGGGGSDYATKHQVGANQASFGGGMGTGVQITPVAFLIVKGENVRMLPVAQAPSTSVDRVLDMIPDLVDKVSAFLAKKEKEPVEEETTEEETV